jgi:hypothetical protein
MDKINSWLMAIVIVLNVALVVGLTHVALTAGPNNSTQEQSVRLLTQLGEELRQGRKVLTPAEQTQLVTNMQLTLKARDQNDAATLNIYWSIIEAIVGALVLQSVVLFRGWSRRSAAAGRKAD